MKPQTIIEKILSNHSDRQLYGGDVGWITLDARSARDFGGANVVNNFNEYYPGEPVDNKEKTFFTFDTQAPAKSIGYANNQMICRNFAVEKGLKVYDVDAGIGSHLMVDLGLILPGGTGVGTDSHMNILGAIGAFGQGMGDTDIAYTFRTGRTWFEVPETIKVEIRGNFKYPATARDLTLKVVGTLGSSGALGKAVEFYGDAIDKLNLSERITLASMGTEMGAIVSLIPPSEEIIKYSEARSGKKVTPVFADEGCTYCQEITIDITNLEPQIACPPKPDNVKSVSEVAGRPVHSIFVGSCTNGRIEDIRIVADILKDKKVAPGVMLRIVPATREVYQQMLQENLIAPLFEAGAIVSNPGCGGCAAGQIGMTGKGEVQISTSNRNFRGKQGDGDTYLASPVTAAWSAILGKIGSSE